MPARTARDKSSLAFLAAFIALGVTAGAWPGGGVLVPTSAQAADKDCSDFNTQRQAQNFFLRHGGPQRDPHGLDGDNDGKACESLPCPCGASSGGGGGGHHNPPPVESRSRGVLKSVVDGDTVKVRTGGKNKTVRLIGIDTPEVYGGEECGGAQASASLKRMVHSGNRITLVRDRTQDDKDRYGRLLRYVEKGGNDLGRRQIRQGWAKVYVYGGNPFNRVRPYRKARDEAKRKDRGVWDRCGGHFHRSL